MSFLGMDIPAALHQAEVLQAHAVDEILSILTGADSLVGQLEGCWKGEDAQRFINDWRSTHLQALRQVHDALAGFVEQLGHNIQTQIAASEG